jgi:hypothetical protein
MAVRKKSRSLQGQECSVQGAGEKLGAWYENKKYVGSLIAASWSCGLDDFLAHPCLPR